jgi:hypothetical protein
MGKQSGLNRRDFLKKTAVGTAGLTAGLSLLKPGKAAAAATATGWTPGMAVNPNISNLRVVSMFDPAMITNPALSAWTVDDYVNAVSASVISTDMDNLAMWLSQKTTPAAAWSTIFQLPAGKTWATVNVAIKINTCNTMNEPRVPVIGKICSVLNGLGVPGAQIAIYDGACGSNPLNIANYFDATGTGTYNGYTKYPGVTSFGDAGLGGSTTNVAVPNMGNCACPTNIANGTIDILVNIGVNKGHSLTKTTGAACGNTGGCTLSIKNHFGTFPPAHGANQTTYAFTVPALTTAVAVGAVYTYNGTSYTVVTAAAIGAKSLQLTGGVVPTGTGTLALVSGTGQASITVSALGTPVFSTADNAIFYSMSPAILGGTPVRQQLCIIDSLWADNNNNPSDAPSLIPARLIMGTFPGAVDYLTCINIKNSSTSQTISGHTYSCGGPDTNLDMAQISHFLTLFGYQTTDPTLDWVAITPASVYTGVRSESVSELPSRTVEIGLVGSGSMARFELPQSTSGALEIRMFDISGRSVRKMLVQLQEGRISISWDGKNDHGSAVAPGTYEVRVTAQNYMKSGRITVE